MEFAHFDKNRSCIVVCDDEVYDYDAESKTAAQRGIPLPGWLVRVSWPGPVAYYEKGAGGAETVALLSGTESGYLSAETRYETTNALHEVFVSARETEQKTVTAYKKVVQAWYHRAVVQLVAGFNSQYGVRRADDDEWRDRTTMFLSGKLVADLGEVIRLLRLSAYDVGPLFDVVVSRFRYDLLATVYNYKLL